MKAKAGKEAAVRHLRRTLRRAEGEEVESTSEEEEDNDDKLGLCIKAAYMSEVENEEMPESSLDSTEFLGNRLCLRKYLRELKLHSTSFWRAQ